MQASRVVTEGRPNACQLGCKVTCRVQSVLVDANQATALHMAADALAPGVISAITKSKAPLDSKDSQQRTALHIAAAHVTGHKGLATEDVAHACVEALIEGISSQAISHTVQLTVIARCHGMTHPHPVHTCLSSAMLCIFTALQGGQMSTFRTLRVSACCTHLSTVLLAQRHHACSGGC